MAIKRHNTAYAAGPTFPLAVGDRYYAQDLFRDLNFKLDDAGRKQAGAYESFPVLIKDSNITKGTLWTDLNIPIAKGIVEYEVDVPNSYAALPPTVTQEDIYVRIETTAEVDFDISGTATLDGVTVNYIKVTYNETDGATRTRAKKAGSYVYEKAVSYTITVSAAAPTNKDLVLGEVVGDGAASMVITCYPRTRHLNAAYDYVVETQEDFNVIIDYTAANQYRIKDSVKSIYVKYLAGGYQMTGATSPLQEGDAYGYIETNDCTRIVFEPGAFIDMHQNIGYIEVDTDYCYLDGVSVQGDKGAASAIQRSFLLNANYVTFANCDSQTRLSNTTFTVFEGSATASHNETSKVVGCKVVDCDSSGVLRMFRYFYNVIGCSIYDIESTGGGVVCFDVITNLKNCRVEKVDGPGTGLIGILNSYNIDNIYMIDFDCSDGFTAVSSCENVQNIHIEDFASTAGVTSYGISSCSQVSNVMIKQLDENGSVYGYYDSKTLSSCYVEDVDSVAGNAYGFYSCENISASYATTCDDGFNDCSNITGCTSYSCINGYNACNQISGSKASSNTTNGFFTCNRISASISSGNGNDGFEDCKTITGCAGNSNTGNGFDGCMHMTGNRASGNTAANYSGTCFADWAGTQAVADTAAGGWNA